MFRKQLQFTAFLLIIIAVLAPQQISAQGIPPNILHFEIEDYSSGEPFRIKAIIKDDGEIDKVLLYFREPGNAQYDFVLFSMEYDKYIAEIPSEFLDFGTLEYYIYVEDTEGSYRTSPEINPEMSPYEYSIVPLGRGNPPDIYLLSPEPGSSIQRGPELVVVSLFDPDDDTVPGSIRLIVDGKDVTEDAQVTRDLITYMPVEEFSTGSHSIEVSARDQSGNMTPKRSFNFSVEEFKAKKESAVKYNVYTSWETRYDKYVGKEQPSNRPIDHNKPRIKAVADAGWLKTEAEVFYNFYADELAQTQSERRQTLNRYRIKFDTRPATVIFGDANPRFSELTIKGTRIRGITGDLRLGFFGLSTFYGESRNIINPYSIADEDSVLVDSVFTPTDTTYIYQYGSGSPTYQRNAFGLRTTFTVPRNGTGFLNTAELGFNYLRFKDNTDDSTAFREDLISIGGYTFADYDSLELANYLLLQGYQPGDPEWDNTFFRWANDTTSVNNKLGSPKDNIVISSTLNFRLFKKTFISFEAAMSLLIDNQYGSRQDIDDIYADQEAGEEISSSDKLILDIDDFMSNNLNFNLNNSLIPFGTPQPALFLDFRTPLPYIPTSFRLNFRRIPDSYNSLGNPSVQSDINAMKVDTRTRFLKNMVMLNFGGEIKTDNLYNSKQVTTTNNTYNAGVGLMVPNWPTLNVGYRAISREGIKDTTETVETLSDTFDITYEITPTQNATNTITVSTGYQLKYQDWRASLNLNTMFMAYLDDKDDQYNFDNNSIILSSSINSPWPWGIDLGLGRSVNNPKFNSETSYTTLNCRFNYYWLNRKLTTYGGLDYLTGKKSEDIDPVNGPTGNGIENTKMTLRAGCKWKITRTMSTSLVFENIDLSDDIDADNSYSENRVKFKWEYRF